MQKDVVLTDGLETPRGQLERGRDGGLVEKETVLPSVEGVGEGEARTGGGGGVGVRVVVLGID